MSDRRLKTNVRRIGETDSGIPISLFNYRGEPEPHVGVMAQDVVRTQPEAVGVVPTGHLAVDYGRL